MATHPLVLLVAPDPLMRELIRGELKDQGCIVYDAPSETDALDFAAVYPGSIDLAVTDLPESEQRNLSFIDALRSLPAGTQAQVLHMSGTGETVPGSATDLGRSYLMKPFNRQSLLLALRRSLAGSRTIHTQMESGDRAVFWGAVDRPPPCVSGPQQQAHR